jgi:hypothetical protein
MLLDAQNSRDTAGVLGGVAAICSALVWPAVVTLVLVLFRKQVAELLEAAVTVASGATRFKIWQIEFDRNVQQEVAQSANAALSAPVAGVRAQPEVSQEATIIPGAEVAAATRVRSLLDAAPSSTLRKEMEAQIRARMLAFAQEYETTRSSMPSGDERTRAMNGVVAKMRTLALAADFLLDELMSASQSPGRRLAAICILQMKPSMSAVPWLVDRMRAERPFVFFHASVALLNAVRRFGASDKAALGTAIDKTLAQVQSFGEAADVHTVRSLVLARSELQA